jgi:hypothetical protein
MKSGIALLLMISTQLDMLAEWESTSLVADAVVFPEDEKYRFFQNTQKAYGKTALLLSGGAIFGLTHIGVVKTLLETRLLPRIISGTSVGSIVAAVICTRKDDDLPVMLDPSVLNLDVFEKRNEQGGWLVIIQRLIERRM